MSLSWGRSVRRVLVDTSAYFASIDARSDDHERSLEVFSQLGAHRRQLFTTNLIVAETHALLLRRLGRDTAARVLRQIDEGATTIARVNAADEQRAKEIIYSQIDKDYTLTDATSFAVMERLHMGTAFTFDRHFVQYGFAVIGLDEP